MGVHNLAEYVAYHQNKLREEQLRSAPQFKNPTPKPKKSSYGVNPIHSKSSYTTSVVGGDKIVLLDCFATWCGPCKMIAPKIAQMSTEDKYKDAVDFYKLDVDEVSDVAAELEIRAMPTFLVFKNGEKVEEVVGANEKAIRAALDKHL
jgi:thioredoxin 1